MADDTKAAEAKPERDVQNEVVRPKDGTDSGKVWAAATELSEKLGRPARRNEVKEHKSISHVNDATFATQYARWVKYHGVGDTIRKGREEEHETKRSEAQAKLDEAKAEKKAKLEAKKKETEQKKAEDKAKRDKDKADKAAKAEADRKAAADKKAKDEADRKAAAETAARKKADEDKAKAAAKGNGNKGTTGRKAN